MDERCVNRYQGDIVLTCQLEDKRIANDNYDNVVVKFPRML